MTTQPDLPTAEAYEVTRILAPRLEQVSKRLRRQADRFEALASALAHRPPQDEGAYSAAVGAAVNDLMNELANLSLGGVISSAGLADSYRATSSSS